MLDRLLSQIRHRLRAVARRDALDAELDDELAFHLERETEKLIARGMPPADAARAARVAFGGVDPVSEASRDARGVQWLDRLRQDVRHAVRQIALDPGFAIVVILTLALGIGANAAIFSLLDRLFFREPAVVAAPHDLIRLYRHQPPSERTDGWITSALPYAAVTNIAGVLPADMPIMTYGLWDRDLGRGEDAPRASTVTFGPGYFDVLGVGTVLGRLPTTQEERIESAEPVALIGHAEWQSRYGGDLDVLGREIELSRMTYTIIGVLPPGFTGVDVSAASYWIPMGRRPANAPPDPYHSSWNYAGANVIVRAGRGNADDVARLASEVAFRGAFDWMTDGRVSAAPLPAALGPQPQPGELAVTTRLAAVALILLLIACANVANLNLARAARRRREIAVRLALGISRARLMMLVTLETLVLALLAAGAALLVAFWAGAVLRTTLFPGTTWAGPVVDLRVALFTLAAGMAAGLVAALPSALRAGRFGLVAALKSGARDGGASRSRLQSGLVAVQAALSVILLVAAGVFVRSLQTVTSIDVGFDADRVVLVGISFDDREQHDDDRRAIMPRVIERLRSLPQVEVVAATNWRPLAEHAWSTLYDEAGTEYEFVREGPSYQIVSSEYFEAMGMRLVSGRLFTAGERDPAAPLIVVNEAMAAQLWPREEAIGRCIRASQADAPCMRVVGVVATAHRDGLIETDAVPHFYRSLAQSTNPTPRVAVVRVRPGTVETVLAAARAQVRQELPAGAYPDVQPLADRFERDLRPWRLGAALFTALGVIALVVAVIGTYSVIGYLVHQRRHELGVRLALGARAGQLAGLVVAEAVRMVGIGVVLGVAGALALGRHIESLLYETSPREPAVLAGVALLLAAAAAAAALLPAWRAARVHPAESLRTD